MTRNSSQTNSFSPQDKVQFSREINNERNQGGGKISQVSNKTNNGARPADSGKDNHAQRIASAWNFPKPSPQAPKPSNNIPGKNETSATNGTKPQDNGKNPTDSKTREKRISDLRGNISRMREVIDGMRKNRHKMSDSQFGEMMQRNRRAMSELEKRVNQIDSKSPAKDNNGKNDNNAKPVNNNNSNTNKVNSNNANTNKIDSNNANTNNAKPQGDNTENANTNGTKPDNTQTGDVKPSNTSVEDWEKKVNFTHFGQQRNPGSTPGKVLSDIEGHLPRKYGGTYREPDKVTWAHETTHGINSHLRNNYRDKPNQEGFYVGNNRAAMIDQPRINKSSVANYIPRSLQNDRSRLYINGQRAFEKQPLYIMDEWTSYTNGGKAGNDLAQQGKWNEGSRDAVAGQLEFTAYSFALGMAVEKQDPEYFKNNKQFKNFLGWHGLHSMDSFRTGAANPEFQNRRQDRFLENFRKSPDAAPLRDFIKRNYGEDYMRRLLYGK